MNTLEKISSILKEALLVAFMLALSHASWAGGWDLKDKDGVHYTLADLRGKWVLVNFWAPWCPSCIQEVPEFNMLQQQHKDLQIIGVAVMYQSRKEVLSKIAKHSILFPTVFGNEDIAGDFGGIDVMPTSFLYNPAGQLIGHHHGPLTQAEIELAIANKPEAADLFER